MRQNFRLFLVSNLSVHNFRIFLLMYPASLTSSRHPLPAAGDAAPEGHPLPAFPSPSPAFPTPTTKASRGLPSSRAAAENGESPAPAVGARLGGRELSH